MRQLHAPTSFVVLAGISDQKENSENLKIVNFLHFLFTLSVYRKFTCGISMGEIRLSSKKSP
ncbi:MAG TPA: hypothetical protein DCG26_07310 [Alphaproteobacteria bacterium]|nr:hypothetical protein [Alphaproteobacteria bacterium]